MPARSSADDEPDNSMYFSPPTAAAMNLDKSYEERCIYDSMQQ